MTPTLVQPHLAVACPTWCTTCVTGPDTDPGSALHRRPLGQLRIPSGLVGATKALDVVLERFDSAGGGEPPIVRLDTVGPVELDLTGLIELGRLFAYATVLLAGEQTGAAAGRT